MGNYTGKMAPQLNTAMEPENGSSTESNTGKMGQQSKKAMDTEPGG
jgi:hypothetical protein